MSKVGGLRAMFEQKADTSPPNRGRSPAESSSAAGSPRPLSKVRTSFIMVEKDGRVGLKRDSSRDSNLSTTTRNVASSEPDVSTPLRNGTSSPMGGQKTKENGTLSALAERVSTKIAASQSQSPSPAPAIPSPQPPSQEIAPKIPSTDQKAAETGLNNIPKQATSKTKSAAPGQNGGATVTHQVAHENADPCPLKTRKTPPVAAAVTGATKGKNASTPRSIKSPKSPTERATFTTPFSPTSNHPPTTPDHHTCTDRPTTPASSTRDQGTQATPPNDSLMKKKPPSVQVSPSGFVKPKSKSPTRPLKLPPGLTTHTASSATRVHPPARPQSRASVAPTCLSLESLRASSRMSMARSEVPGGTGNLSVRSKNLVNRTHPWPAVGPPPQPRERERPPPRNDQPVDQNFLARMMRPTRASASKTHEKIVSPPRKTAKSVKRPISQLDVTKHPRLVSKSTSGSVIGVNHAESTPAPSLAQPSPPQPVEPVADGRHTPQRPSSQPKTPSPLRHATLASPIAAAPNDAPTPQENARSSVMTVATSAADTNTTTTNTTTTDSTDSTLTAATTVLDQWTATLSADATVILNGSAEKPTKDDTAAAAAAANGKGSKNELPDAPQSISRESKALDAT